MATCDNCGAEIKSLHAGFFMDSASGELRDYKMTFKKFCSLRCLREYKQDNYQQMKTILSSKDSKGFRKLLIRRNPTFWIDAILVFATAIVLTYLSFRGSSFSFFFIPIIVVLIIYGILRIAKPWVVAHA